MGRILKILFIAVFIIEAVLDGGTLCFSDTVAVDMNNKLSPPLMSPNNLITAESGIKHEIEAGLRENLKSILKGQDIKNISYARFMSILKETESKESTAGTSALNPELPWFFMNEAHEKNGDILVQCRLYHNKELKDYYVVFRLDKDHYDGFVIKGIYADNEIERLISDLDNMSAVKRISNAENVRPPANTSIAVAGTGEKSEAGMRLDLSVKKTSGVRDAGKNAREAARTVPSPARRDKVLAFLSRMAVTIIIVAVITFGFIVKGQANTKKIAPPDYPKITTSFLENISPKTTFTYINMSKKTGLSITDLMAVELTEVNDKGVQEINDENDAKRITSKKGAVGAWQLMPRTVEDANKYIRTINTMRKNKKYIPRVDRGKMNIIKKFRLQNGIDIKKVDHNSPDYDADYNRRVAAMVLAVNRYMLGRVVLVKNKRSPGWHFNMRKEGEAPGFDVDKAVVITQNFSMDALMDVLRKAGPDPKNYTKYLEGETRGFLARHRAFRKVLNGECQALLNIDIYKEKQWERNIERIVERSKNAPKTYLSGPVRLKEGTRKDANMLPVFLIAGFAGILIFLAGLWIWDKKRNKGIDMDAALLDFVLAKNRNAVSRQDTAGVTPVDNIARTIAYPFEPAVVDMTPDTISFTPVAQNITETPAIPDVIRLARNEQNNIPAEVKNVGITLSPPVEKYTIYISTGLCSVREFEADKGKFGSRFDLELVPKDNAGKIVGDVLGDVQRRGINPKMVVVQLPAVSKKDEISAIEKLKEADIRFVTIDVESYKSAFPSEKEREAYRESIYAIMLLVRKVSSNTNDPLLIGFLKDLVENYTGGTQGKDKMFKEYLRAIVNGDVRELVKVILIYKPFEKLVDDLGNRWDAKTLIFA